MPIQFDHASLSTQSPGTRQPRWRSTAIMVRLLLLCLILSHAAMADDQRKTGERMADAMTRMMEAFGFSEADRSEGDLGQSMPMPEVMSKVMPDAMPDTLPMSPQNPDWFSHFGNPIQEFGMPDLYQRFGKPLDRWQSTSLNGIWEGRAGGLLIIKGYRYRLYQPNAGYIDGLIQQRGDRIALYNPATNSARPYEFALQRGRLALRDAAGTLFLYRRLWLEQDLVAEPPSPDPQAAEAWK